MLNGCTGSVSNEEIKENLTRQIDYGLQKQHKFFKNGKESKITELVDGYLGQVTDQQLLSLSFELVFVDFPKTKNWDVFCSKRIVSYLNYSFLI